MTIEVRYSVMTPEAGIQKTLGGPPPVLQSQPGMLIPQPRAGGGARSGSGGPPPRPAAPVSFSPARRLDTLENKTIYLVDTGFGGSYLFMQQVQRWFSEHMPSVKTIRKRKTGQVFMDDTVDLWEEVKANGHGVVLGVAG